TLAESVFASCCFFRIKFRIYPLAAHEFIHGSKKRVDKIINRFNGLMMEDFSLWLFLTAQAPDEKTDESVRCCSPILTPRLKSWASYRWV
ncbi:MAG: hypothetical protein KAT86_01210, partial [Candidatus Latescibacteria bacterium]|nr:hypothetical protein [Candidatus Latescibacterota bacterium]